jgi:peptidoglycan DL-endopeptidase CwlO
MITKHNLEAFGSVPRVRAAGPTRAARILVAILAVVSAGIAARVGGADPASQLRSRADQLRHESSRLATESHAALLQLYALESELARARSQVSTLAARQQAVQSEQRQVRFRLRLARQSYSSAEQNVETRLRALYEEGDDVDPLAVILGASSFDDAVTRLDRVNRIADLDRRVAARAKSARSRLGELSRSLAQREVRLEALSSQAEAAAAALQSSQAERAAYVSRLASQRRLDDAQISSLDARARAAERRSAAAARAAAAAQPPPAAAPTSQPSPAAAAPQSPSAAPGRRLTVIATAYSLPGHTASGLPVGPGVVAVDPTVIPMGTRMTIPGYGEGVAADTGGAIKGNRIDVWFPTNAQCIQWGVKTVTITLH